MDESLTEEQRFPLLNDAGRRMLNRLREHPHAPKWNYRVGERLSAQGLAKVRAYAERLTTDRLGWRPGELPLWLIRFIEFCRRDVPFYRRREDWTDDFFELPPLARETIRRQPWAFVPDSADLTELIVYMTSGTTGACLIYPSHPEVPNRYLPLMQTALADYGVHLEGGDRVSLIHVCAQISTYTLVSVMSFLDFAGYAKINLHPAEWKDPDDRVRFLDNCNPELYTGDPFSLSELAKLPLQTRPKAILSGAMTLLPGLKKQLEEHFGCPVIDWYSLNESGPVAYAKGPGHEILPHDLYVEILDAEGRACPPGVRGEITLSGGVNPYLPLLRYRTGDYAAMDCSGPLPLLIDFQGRAPTIFRTASGERFNSIDVSTVLRDLPLPFFSLHQSADGSLHFRTRSDESNLAVAEGILRKLFGMAQPLTVENVPDSVAWSGKAIQYTSAMGM